MARKEQALADSLMRVGLAIQVAASELERDEIDLARCKAALVAARDALDRGIAAVGRAATGQRK